MARNSSAQFIRSRLAVVALPLIMAAFASLAACDKNNDQPDRRYCDQSGCFACNGDRCYPVPGDPAKPDPGTISTCDNDAACGADKVCNLGLCTPSCKDNSSCANTEACISGRCRPSGSAQCGIVGAGCTTDSQCTSSQRCVSNRCATSCPDSKCPTGQVCQAGSCIEDPSPKTSECVFDTDCASGKGGFRCINAYCLATCADSSSCTGGSTCLKGVCRGSH